MQHFSYHRKAPDLRAQVNMFFMVMGFELVVYLVGMLFIPRPWNLVALVIVAVLGIIIYRRLTTVLHTQHRVDSIHLHVAYGAFRLQIPRAEISSMAPYLAPVPKAVRVSISAQYHPHDDTLYILADRKRLVAITLANPMQADIPLRGTAHFTRIVLTLDEPEQFLAVLGGAPPAPQPSPHPVQAEVRPILPAITQTGAAITLTNLSKRYGDFEAVRSINLSVQPGEIVAFLGANGAGKTTTIKMMTGLLRPTEGQVLIGGHDAWTDGPAARRIMGYVPDIPFLHEGLTAREFLWLVAGLYEIKPREGRQRAEELLAFLAMERWGDHLIRTFSLGMKRKMAIAAALVHRPQVLLLDEATNGLDPRAAREIKDFIAATARAGTAVLLTTHLLDVAQELADRIAVIDRGQILAVGPLSELQQQCQMPGANLEQLFLALTGDGDRAGVSA